MNIYPIGEYTIFDYAVAETKRFNNAGFISQTLDFISYFNVCDLSKPKIAMLLEKTPFTTSHFTK